jgi:MbtH protein
MPDPVWGENVAAWIKQEAGCAISAADVMQFCRGRIASFKIPRHISFVTEFRHPHRKDSEIPHPRNRGPRAFRRGRRAFINKETYAMDNQEDNKVYGVVVNHEEQYSIWPADRENAPGWNDAGRSGAKAECLAWIKEVWTDMRPLSLRLKMAEAGV